MPNSRTSSTRRAVVAPRPKALPAAGGSGRATSANALCAELAGLIGCSARTDGGHPTALPDLTLWRFSNPTEPVPVIQAPAIYVVVQGRKQVVVGGETYVYDRTQYLAVSLELPAISSVLEATPEAPYLCLTFRVDARELASLIIETGQHAPRDGHDGRALFVSALDAPLLDALLRYICLLDAPHDIAVLAPLIRREIHYRLLHGDQHGRLAEMAIGDGRLRRVAGALAWMKEHYAEPLRVEDLAKRANMSSSALHAHFGAVTGMSPIQYQKQMRLQEARSRLLAGSTSAEAVAYEVGYASPSQFSREYARLFGQPPRRDADAMRADQGAREFAESRRSRD